MLIQQFPDLVVRILLLTMIDVIISTEKTTMDPAITAVRFRFNDGSLMGGVGTRWSSSAFIGVMLEIVSFALTFDLLQICFSYSDAIICVVLKLSRTLSSTKQLIISRRPFRGVLGNISLSQFALHEHD